MNRDRVPELAGSSSTDLDGVFRRARRASRAFVAVGVFLASASAAAAAGIDHARAALEAEGKREFDAAIELYTKAIEAGDLSKENLADVHAYRGNARFFLGRFTEAASDYEASLTVNPKAIYPAFWLYIARARSGQDGRAELTKNSARLKDLFYWPGPIAALFLGKATPKAVVAGAEDPFLDARRQREQLCEAHFYVGQYHLLNGRTAEAAAAFKKALATGAKDFVEHSAAKVELERLGQP